VGKRAKIAPVLTWLVNPRGPDPGVGGPEGQRRAADELRSLLAIARAAREVRLRRRPIVMSEEAFMHEEHACLNATSDAETTLHRALSRLARLSVSGREGLTKGSTVEGSARPASKLRDREGRKAP
jgi:hypothetical protein